MGHARSWLTRGVAVIASVLALFPFAVASAVADPYKGSIMNDCISVVHSELSQPFIKEVQAQAYSAGRRYSVHGHMIIDDFRGGNVTYTFACVWRQGNVEQVLIEEAH